MFPLPISDAPEDVGKEPWIRSGMPEHLDRVQQVETMRKKQDHGSLTPILQESQPWEQ